MPRILPDIEIAALLAEKKRLPSNWRAQFRPKVKSNTNFGQNELRVTGDKGNVFTISLRTCNLNLLDFSVILAYSEKGHDYNLVRHNGKHKSRHTNIIESRLGLPDCVLSDVFHIHHGTERYQTSHLQIEGFAEPTALYSNVDGAINLMVSRYGFMVEVADTILPLFDEGVEQ